jgi:hypothetical protein
VRQKRIERIEAGCKNRFNVIHRVKQPDIRFDEPPSLK